MTRPARATGVGRADALTFRGNLGATRHGFLRLTPAYSVHLVRDLLERKAPAGAVLDPFCGTGTTLLACAELGLDCTTIDLNPFLVWLAGTKVATYAAHDVAKAERLVGRMASAARARSGAAIVPPIHRIDRWWDAPVAAALGRAWAIAGGARVSVNVPSRNLAKIAFCRAVIECANVSFGHQSMSFRKRSQGASNGASGSTVASALDRAFAALAGSVAAPLPASRREVLLGDSRSVHAVVGRRRFSTVVTSPPYPNRMSYVRELRPYMYWLGYLAERRDAGELDWRAIGGTWGAATSRLGDWRANPKFEVPYDGFERIVRRIGEHEPLLGRYVARYFEDMARHTKSLARIVAPNGRVRYVVGNSKFYDVLLPVQEIFAALFEGAGFRRPVITVLRKRTSKRELFEYLVEAEKPGPDSRS